MSTPDTPKVGSFRDVASKATKEARNTFEIGQERLRFTADVSKELITEFYGGERLDTSPEFMLRVLKLEQGKIDLMVGEAKCVFEEFTLAKQKLDEARAAWAAALADDVDTTK